MSSNPGTSSESDYLERDCNPNRQHSPCSVVFFHRLARLVSRFTWIFTFMVLFYTLWLLTVHYKVRLCALRSFPRAVSYAPRCPALCWELAIVSQPPAGEVSSTLKL